MANNTACNRFGSSSYVVGTPANGLGNGVNFTSIQAAVNQAVADGYGIANPVDIIIRAGIYSEDVTITDGGIALVGVSSGSTNLVAQQTFIQGTITLNITGSNQFSLSNLLISGQTGPALSITGGPNPIRMAATNCTFLGTTSGTFAVSMTNFSGTLGWAIFTSCFMNGLEGINSSARTVSVCNNCSITSGTNAFTLDGSARVRLHHSFVSAGAYGVQFLSGVEEAKLSFSAISANLAAVDSTPGGSVEIQSCSINSGDASGNFIIGTANLKYADIINEGSAINLDPGLSAVIVSDWKPYAEAGLPPGSGVVRGTSAFSSDNFSVTDGFVQTNFSGIFPTIDQAVSTTVLSNTRNMGTALVTLTLPAAPSQGDVCSFTDTVGGVLTIQTSGTQKLEINSSFSTAGGTATSSIQGDSVILVYQSSTDTWWCDGSALGVWVLT